MTDKVALVRLRAKNDQYDAAMAKSAKLTNDLAATADRFDGMSQKLDRVGSDLTRGVTLPLSLAGAASYKLASDFNKTFTQMATLAGVPVDQLEGLKQSVLDLARETGQAPAELAESLYQIYSSGVPASEAMSVLKASAQGAALGLGEAAGVADAVTSAINTYGAENLSAAEATDQLTAAVKAGKGEAAAFAPQLGNLLPLASELGISFADTAGSLAYLTRGGNNAATASTKLEGVMRALVKPTQQGRDVLEQVGLSADKLRQVVAEKGLPAALELLQEKFAGNNELMGKFFEDSEGYIGNLALMKGGGEEWAKVLQEVNDSQGLVAEGMAILQDTPEFQAQQALADLQATMVEVGTALMPILSSLAGGIADLAGVFSSLPGPVQAGLVAIGLFAASLGPLVSLAGNAAKAVSLFAAAANARQLDGFRLGLMGVTEAGAGASNALGGFIAAAGGMSIAVGAAGGVTGGAGLILWDYAAQANRAEEATRNLRAEAERTGQTIEETFADQLARLFVGAEGGYNIGPSDNLFRKILTDAGIGIKELSDALNGSEKEWQAFLDRIEQGAAKNGGSSAFQSVKVDLDQLRTAQADATHQSEALAAAQASLGVGTGSLADKQRELTGETEGGNEALSKQADEILGILDAQRGAIDATDAYNDSIVAVAEAQQAERDAAAAVDEAEQGVTAARERAAEAAAAIEDAERNVAKAREGVADALRNVEKAEQDAADAAQVVVDRTLELATAQREATGDSDEMRDALEGVQKAEDDLAAAQADRLTAQQELDAATANYDKTLAGLARSAGGAADDVLTAEIRLRAAQEALATLGRDGKPVTADDRLAAEIAVRDAERAVQDARDRAAAAQEELDRNRRNGVEGSDAVAAASERVADAADNETEAQRRLDAAHQNVADVREAANQRVVDAERNLADAIDARAEADQRVVDAKDGVVDAQDRVRDAIAGVDKASRDAAAATDAIGEAQAKVTKAKQGVVDAHAAVEEKIKAVGKAALEAAIAIYGMDSKTGGAASAARDLATHLRDVASKLSPDDPLRQSILDTASALDDMADDYQININLGGNAAQAILDGTLGDLFGILTVATGGKSTPGGKGGGVPSGKPGASVPAASAPSGPRTKPGGWIEQANGNWWRPRKPGEANYGDGYVSYDEMLRMIQADEAAKFTAAMSAHGAGAFADATPQIVDRSTKVYVTVDGAKWENPNALATVIGERVAYKVSLEEG